MATASPAATKPAGTKAATVADKKTPLSVHLLAGGLAGLSEACACHPLDTIKVRMQLRNKQRGSAKRGFIATGVGIAQKEGPLALYKGLGAVISGIVPKMAIRFASFEQYKSFFADKATGKVTPSGIFFAGLGAGVTEAVAVVCPMEVVKIRLQAQSHSMVDPLDVPKYRNAAHALYLILKEEGPRTLYRGVALTALRQATNQAANFTSYTYLRAALQNYQPELKELPSWQTMTIGLISGAVGPFTNAPIDTIKTRIQKATALAGETAWTRITKVAGEMFAQEGPRAFYKGITPRVARVAPGQAVVFAVYEKVKKWVESLKNEEKDVAEWQEGWCVVLSQPERPLNFAQNDQTELHTHCIYVLHTLHCCSLHPRSCTALSVRPAGPSAFPAEPPFETAECVRLLE